jgi:uncharacterized protein YjdB
MKKFGTYLLMIGVALLGAALIASCKPPDPPLYPPAPNITGPEYGLYWFGKDDANTLALPGEENPYYDPDRPTIIYVHGWKPNQGYSHRTMVWKFEDDSGQEQAVDLAAAWVDAGWNVGVFDWGPFADEPIVTDAEAKIWTTEGGEGMRWRDREGEYRTDHSVDIPISQLFYGALVQALADFHGPELRIAGHSLGNQVAVGALAKVMDDVEANKLPPEMIPTQVLLLDPYWSPVVQDYLDERKPGTAVREIIKDVLQPRDVLVSWYQSSLMTDGILISDDNPQLRSLVAIYQRMEPDYCPLTDQVCRHEAAWQSYFYSFAFDPPQVCTRPDKDAPCESTGKAAASASTPEERLREMAGLPVFYEQVSAFKDDNSMYTRRTDDDRYERRSLENKKN